MAAKPRSKKKLPDKAAPPTSASLQAAEVEQNAALLAQQPEAIDAAALADAAGQLERHFRAIRQRAQQIHTGKRARAALAGAVPAAAAAAPIAPLVAPAPVTAPPPTAPGAAADNSQGLAAFFRDVSQSVINAQKELDAESLAYALDRRGSPTPGSLYSIPKVTAQIKAGFSTKGAEKINIILFSKSSDIETYGESTISFDVAAGPPPPGALDQFKAPVPPFLLSGDGQNAILAIVQNAGVAAGFNDAAWQQRAVVFHTGDAAFPFLVLIPGTPASGVGPAATLLVQVKDAATAIQSNVVNRPELAVLAAAIRGWLDQNTVQPPASPHA